MTSVNDSNPTLTQSDPVQEPSAEPSPTGDEKFEQAKQLFLAARRERDTGRLPNGQIGKGNTLALRHGLRSEQLPDQPGIKEWHTAQAEAITADLGGPTELTALARASVREVARLEVILAALGEELLNGGVLTGKGQMRAATTTYLMVLDRFMRLSAALGLQRRQKPVTNPIDAVREAVKKANDTNEGAQE